MMIRRQNADVYDQIGIDKMFSIGMIGVEKTGLGIATNLIRRSVLLAGSCLLVLSVKVVWPKNSCRMSRFPWDQCLGTRSFFSGGFREGRLPGRRRHRLQLLWVLWGEGVPGAGKWGQWAHIHEEEILPIISETHSLARSQINESIPVPCPFSFSLNCISPTTWPWNTVHCTTSEFAFLKAGFGGKRVVTHNCNDAAAANKFLCRENLILPSITKILFLEVFCTL